MMDGEASHRRSNGIKVRSLSTFEAAFSIVSGFILAALLYTVCDIDVKDVPVVIMILLWVVFSALMAEFAEKIGLSRKSDNIGTESSENGGKTLLLVDERNTL